VDESTSFPVLATTLPLSACWARPYSWALNCPVGGVADATFTEARTDTAAMMVTRPGSLRIEISSLPRPRAGYSPVTLPNMARRWRYSRWDGTQAGFELDAEGVLGEIADDLLYHGDLNAALRRALQSGMRAPDGRQLEGLRQLLERIARRRREELERHELSGLGEDIARRLDEIVDQERQGLDRGEIL